MFNVLQFMNGVLLIIACVLAAVIVSQFAVAAGYAYEEYKASIRHVAGGPNLDEVQMFEDNYVRCYVIKADSHCFQK